MASESQERKQKEQEIRYLASTGMSQRAIGRRLGISRPMVQRVLEKAGIGGVDAAGSIPAGQPDDFLAVAAEFDEMFRLAKESGDIDAFRRVHKVARTCFEEGYRVSYGTLPYIVALSSAQAGENIDSPAGRQRRKGWGLEIDSVYDFTK